MSKRLLQEKIFQIVDSQWNLAGDVKTLAGFEDLNFCLKSADESKYLIKVSQGEFDENLDFQIKALLFMERRDEKLGVEIPKLILSTRGKPFLHFEHAKRSYCIRVHSWVPGKMFVDFFPKSKTLLDDLGRKAGKILNLLKGFSHPVQIKENYDWDLANSIWVKDKLTLLKTNIQPIVAKFVDKFLALQSIYKELPKAVIHNDINDYNILVEKGEVSGFIDYGDMCYTQRVNDISILLAYAMMFHNDPLDAASEVLRGYKDEVDLSDEEVKCIFTLSAMRLSVSTVSAAINLTENPENEYLQVTGKPAEELLEKLNTISEDFAELKFRSALGKPISTKLRVFDDWVQENWGKWSRVCPLEIGTDDYYVLDLGIGSTELGHEILFNDPTDHHASIQKLLRERQKTFAIGQYNEVRPLYSSEDFADLGNQGRRWRTLHIGLDFFQEAGTEVYAFFKGRIHSVQVNPGDKNYGNTIIIEHESEDITFYTLYGHLSSNSLNSIKVGQHVDTGELIAWFGKPEENGNWAPHLHFQIILDMLDYKGDFPGVCFLHEREIFANLCPDPTPLFEIESEKVKKLTAQNILQKRKALLGRSYSISYKKNLHIARAYNQYLYDQNGRKYLDCVNNVPHVGHQNTRVIEAAKRQMALLNTNTRYLHQNIVLLAETLTATLPDHLKVCHFVNSGSEANELAIRMARAFTSRYDVVAMEHGYHGNTNLNVDMSSYKFDGKGGSGKKDYIHILEMPEAF